jgi:hypothetical protein
MNGWPGAKRQLIAELIKADCSPIKDFQTLKKLRV